MTDDLEGLVMTALSRLHREDQLKHTMDVMASEWYTSSAELRTCLCDATAWAELKLPGRLKLELKDLLQDVGGAAQFSATGTAEGSEGDSKPVIMTRADRDDSSSGSGSGSGFGSGSVPAETVFRAVHDDTATIAHVPPPAAASVEVPTLASAAPDTACDAAAAGAVGAEVTCSDPNPGPAYHDPGSNGGIGDDEPKENWLKCYSVEDDAIYYCNMDTDTTQWEEPRNTHVTVDDSVTAYEAAAVVAAAAAEASEATEDGASVHYYDAASPGSSGWPSTPSNGYTEEGGRVGDEGTPGSLYSPSVWAGSPFLADDYHRPGHGLTRAQSQPHSARTSNSPGTPFFDADQLDDCYGDHDDYCGRRPADVVPSAPPAPFAPTSLSALSAAAAAVVAVASPVSTQDSSGIAAHAVGPMAVTAVPIAITGRGSTSSSASTSALALASASSAGRGHRNIGGGSSRPAFAQTRSRLRQRLAWITGDTSSDGGGGNVAVDAVDLIDVGADVEMYVNMVGDPGVIYHDASDGSDDDGGSECDSHGEGDKWGCGGGGGGRDGYLASLHDGGDTTAYGGIAGRDRDGVSSFRIAHGDDSGFAGGDEDGMADLAELALDSSGEDFIGGAHAHSQGQGGSGIVVAVGEPLVPQGSIARLQEMGFQEAEAVEALIASKGQLAQAAALLASNAEHAPTTAQAAAAAASAAAGIPQSTLAQGMAGGPVPVAHKSSRLPKMNLFARGRR